MVETMSILTESMKSGFNNLNGRITGLPNQHRCTDEAKSSIRTDIYENIEKLKSDLDKKSNTILVNNRRLLIILRAYQAWTKLKAKQKEI